MNDAQQRALDLIRRVTLDPERQASERKDGSVTVPHGDPRYEWVIDSAGTSRVQEAPVSPTEARRREAFADWHADVVGAQLRRRSTLDTSRCGS